MIVLWAVAAAVFLVVELITVAMVSIWLMVGAIAALIAALCGAAVWLQTVLFVAVSVVCFLILYPRLKKLVGKNRQATNLDRVIGATCVVTQRIDNLAGTGAVTVDGKTWTARTEDGSIVEADALVKVLRIDGVKLIVGRP